MTTVDAVRERLNEVVDPCSAATGSNLDIVEMGLVDTISIDGDHVKVQMLLTTPICHMVLYLIREVGGQVGDLSGVGSIELQTDHGLEWTEDMMSDEAKARREELFARQVAKYEQKLGPRTRLTKMTCTRQTSAANRDPPAVVGQSALQDSNAALLGARSARRVTMAVSESAAELDCGTRTTGRCSNRTVSCPTASAHNCGSRFVDLQVTPAGG